MLKYLDPILKGITGGTYGIIHTCCKTVYTIDLPFFYSNIYAIYKRARGTTSLFLKFVHENHQ